jgi:GxxExxY protein
MGSTDDGRGHRSTRIDADQEPRPLKHEDVTGQILAAFYDVYNELGPGFLEVVYQRALAIALAGVGVHAAQEAPYEVRYRGQIVGVFRPDLLVADCVIVEVKSARAIDNVHRAQLLNYLRATALGVGLLLNFGPQPTFARMVFDTARK